MLKQNDSTLPISPSEARQLFSHLKTAPAIIVAVSGGPDSTALLWLMARWRKALGKGPKLVAVTVDHALRAESAREARSVKRLAKSLGVEHRTLKWRGPKPQTGLQAAARGERYRLLSGAARRAGATHVVTAHSRDDQAETVLMRMSRGSGIGGLGGMAKESSLPFFSPRPASAGRGRSRAARSGEGPSLSPCGRGCRSEAKAGEGPLLLTRPLLDLPKSRLIATLHANGVSFTEDTSNRDPRFTRVRWRALMPPLADEGLDARNLARLAERAGRAEAALELAALGAERALVRPVAGKTHRLACDRLAFAALPDEIRLRLLGRMIARAGLGGPPELGKLETMLDAVNSLLTGRPGERLKRTLAGAIVAVDGAKIAVERAPPRRHASRKA